MKNSLKRIFEFQKENSKKVKKKDLKTYKNFKFGNL